MSLTPDSLATPVEVLPPGPDDWLVRSGAHTLVTSVVSVGVGLVSSIVVARALGPDDKGGYDLMLATASLLVVVVGLSLPAGTTYAIARARTVPLRLVAICGAAAFAQGLVAGLLVAMLQLTRFSEAFAPASVGLAAVVPTGLLVGSLLMAAYLRSMLVGRGRIVAANWRDLTMRTMGLGAVLVAAAATSVSLTDAVPRALVFFWMAVAVSLGGVLVFLAAVRRDVTRGSPVDARALVRFTAPTYAANLSQYLNYSLDLFLVGLLLGTSQVGLYSLAVMLGQLIWLVASAAAAPLLPQVAAAPGATAANSRAATRLSRLVTGVSVAGAIVILATAWAIVPLVYGPAFSASVEPLLILLPGIVALAPAKVLASYVAGVGRPALNLVVSLVSLAVTLVLDLLLIPTIGIAGAAIASTAAYLVGAVMTVAVFRRLTRVRARDILLPTVEDLRQLRGAIAAGATGRRAR